MIQIVIRNIVAFIGCILMVYTGRIKEKNNIGSLYYETDNRNS